ncbi:hypothetical protein LDENG_00285040 [Lucifuga dentata]|nr:hypothetical protein LDENG_00285040 [Lucifuga dentata]
MFCKQCLDIIPEEHNSIDEQMVSFRGTQPNKAHHWCSSFFSFFVGTLRTNRLAGCQLEDEKSLAKRSRGSVDSRVEKEESMVIIKWYDNKSVTLISSYCAVEPQDKAQCWNKSDKAFVEVNRPHTVKE